MSRVANGPADSVDDKDHENDEINKSLWLGDITQAVGVTRITMLRDEDLVG